MNEQIISFFAQKTDENNRIDKFLSEQEEGLSRSYIQKLIKDKKVLVNNKPVKSNYRIIEKDEVVLFIPKLEELNIQAENIPLDILYEDEDIILINKGKDMVVHPAPGHYTGTIVNALLYHCKDNLSGINGVMRPGIVHRIDRNTTGIIVVCKNDKAHNCLAEQLKKHSITRKYNAIVYNTFKEANGTVNAPIGRHPIDRKKMAVNAPHGKEAITHYEVLKNLGNRYALIECTLETGRTHQIRVHMASIGHPLVGDDVYGPSNSKFKLEGQALHARVLGFIHPSTETYMEFEAPIPEYFTELVQKLEH